MAKSEKVFIKLKRAHTSGFRLGKHLIKMGTPKEYELDEKEQAEIKTAGPKHWLQVISQEEMDAAPKSNSENKAMQDLKKVLVKKGVELDGKESLQDLKDMVAHVEMLEALRAQCEAENIKIKGDETIEELEALIG